VLAYAHRGGAREGPSNTLAAMRAALDVGATALELDLHATSDGRLVVCHDPTVDRTTNGSGVIAKMTLAQVRSLDAAWWFVPGEEVCTGLAAEAYPFRGRAPHDPSYAIPTLEEVLEAFPGVLLNLDIKQTAPAVAPYEATLARVLAEHERVDDVIVASFNPRSLAAFSALAPQVATAAASRAIALIWLAGRLGCRPLPTRHRAIQVPLKLGDITVLDRRLVRAAHRAGVAVHVWTIDDPVEMESLVDLGVDGIISDSPTVLSRVLAERGAAWQG
jgi:glycerophosphoryl diester phosphodiesterase